MNRIFRITLIVLATFIGFAALGYFGLVFLSRSITKGRSCASFNIDNVEIHAEIDVPALVNDSCYCKAAEGIKQNRFRIHDEVRLANYITVNKLVVTEEGEAPDTAGFLSPEQYHPDHRYFVRTGTYKDERWRILLDSNSRTLWVTIWYGKEK